VDKKENALIFYLLLLMYFSKWFQLKLFHYDSNLTKWNTILVVIRWVIWKSDRCRQGQFEITIAIILHELYDMMMSNNITVKIRKPWTPIIYLECSLCYNQSRVRSSTTGTLENCFTSIHQSQNKFVLFQKVSKQILAVYFGSQEIRHLLFTGYLNINDFRQFEIFLT